MAFSPEPAWASPLPGTALLEPLPERPGPVAVRRLGTRPYEQVWRAMQRKTRHGGPDELWLLQHESGLHSGSGGENPAAELAEALSD